MGYSSHSCRIALILRMITYKIMPDPTCKACRGTGQQPNVVPWGSTYATEWLLCDCILEQLPKDSDWEDPVEVVFNQDEVYLGEK